MKPEVKVIRHSFSLSQGLGAEDLPAFEPERITVSSSQSASGHVTLFVQGPYRPEGEADGLALEIAPTDALFLAEALLTAAVEPEVGEPFGPKGYDWRSHPE